MGTLPPKFYMPNIKFHEIENPHHYMRNFVSAITLKDIDQDIFHIIFPWAFDKEIMK